MPSVLREILVAQADDISHDGCKLRVGSWLAIACECEDVGRRTVGLHVEQTGFEGGNHLLVSWELGLRTVVGIESAFAVDAVETAHLAVGRQ